MEDVLEVLNEYWKQLVGAICCIGLLLLVILVPVSLSKLEFDEVGLIYYKLACTVDDTVVLQQGLHNVGPSGTILSFQTTQRSAYYARLNVLTSDGLQNVLTVTVTHSIVPSLQALLAVQLLYGSQAAYDAYIKSRAEYVTRNTASMFTAAQFFAERQTFQTALFTAMAGMFNSSFIYSSLNLVQVENIDLPTSVDNVLSDVTTSEQDIQNADAERTLQVREAQILVSLARSNAEITLLNAQKAVTSIRLQNAQDVSVVQARYTNRNSVFSNASLQLGVMGDDFVRAYVLPIVLSANVAKGIVSV